MGLPAIGSKRIHLPSVDSTNKYAAELLEREELAHGTVILADEQTAGEGQRGRPWISTPGSDLTLSVVLVPPDMSAAKQFGIAQLAALAIKETVEAEDVQGVQVKWPNDVLVEDRKIAGVLIANELVGQQLARSVVGIGLNVNSSGNEQGPPATSISMELLRRVDRDALLERLLAAMEHRWQLLIADPGRLAVTIRQLATNFAT